MTHRRGVLVLVGVAAVWGCSFTVTKQALGAMSPVVLVALRFMIAAALVSGFLYKIDRRELRAGIIVGLLFWAGFVFQTMGLVYTTPSRSAFVTGLSTPLVPVVYLLVHRAAPRVATVVGILLAAVGTYFLTDPGDGGLNRGDILTLGCAVTFAGQIVAAGYFSRRVAPARLLAVQLALTGLLSLGAAPVLETPRLELGPLVIAALAFLSLSAVVTFYYQLRAQQVVSPSQTALIFALEPVFAAIVSYLVIGERLSATQWLGAGLILGAMVIPEMGRNGRARGPAPTNVIKAPVISRERPTPRPPDTAPGSDSPRRAPR